MSLITFMLVYLESMLRRFEYKQSHIGFVIIRFEYLR